MAHPAYLWLRVPQWKQTKGRPKRGGWAAGKRIGAGRRTGDEWQGFAASGEHSWRRSNRTLRYSSVICFVFLQGILSRTPRFQQIPAIRADSLKVFKVSLLKILTFNVWWWVIGECGVIFYVVNRAE